jgi:hypothetical protein
VTTHFSIRRAGHLLYTSFVGNEDRHGLSLVNVGQCRRGEHKGHGLESALWLAC